MVPLVKVILCAILRGNLFFESGQQRNLECSIKRLLIGIITHFNFHGIQSEELLNDDYSQGVGFHPCVLIVVASKYVLHDLGTRLL